jgi:tetratricopeptide (TPR) repeat protein
VESAVDFASIIIRASFLSTSILALTGSALELAVSSRLQSDFKGNQALCRLFLCEERAVANYAYQQQIQGTERSVQVAAGVLRNIVLRDSASAQRWADLGDVLAHTGSIGEARYCFDRSLELGKTSADVLVAAGDFYLRYVDKREGLRCLSRTLMLTPRFDEAVFGYFTARDTQIQDLLRYGLPQERRPTGAYLRYLISQHALPSAQALWRWMKVHKLTDQQLTVDYSNFLIAEKQYEEAAEAWASQLGNALPGYRKTEYLFNRNFENEPIPRALFDWSIIPLDGVEIAREGGARPSVWSLRIRFDGSANVDFRNVSQEAVLPPGKYRFRAYARTDSITTDEGLFVRIADVEAPNRLRAETEPMAGTLGWRPIECTFVIPIATRLVEITVVRRPSLRFDNKIKGTVWIERASLERI